VQDRPGYEAWLELGETGETGETNYADQPLEVEAEADETKDADDESKGAGGDDVFAMLLEEESKEDLQDEATKRPKSPGWISPWDFAAPGMWGHFEVSVTQSPCCVSSHHGVVRSQPRQHRKQIWYESGLADSTHGRSEVSSLLLDLPALNRKHRKLISETMISELQQPSTYRPAVLSPAGALGAESWHTIGQSLASCVALAASR